jgi:hypothetical protein
MQGGVVVSSGPVSVTVRHAGLEDQGSSPPHSDTVTHTL